MTSVQLPPPSASFSFPPEKPQLDFNYLDSFVTSWVTPESSQDPCFFSICFSDGSSGDSWTTKSNETVSLNGTRLVSLAFIDSNGYYQLFLNYVDPLGGHKHIGGKSFHINHDPDQSKAMTWNQDALTSSPTTPASTQALSVPISSAYTTPAPPSSTRPTPSAAGILTSSAAGILTPSAAGILTSSAAGILTPSSTSTATQASSRVSSSSHGGEYASIALGTTLAVVLTAALLIVWIRRKRNKKSAEQAVQLSSATPGFVQNKPHKPHEKDGEVVSNELGDESGRWEMDTNRR